MPKPIAVLISDVHYSLPTLEVADKAMRLAIAKANELDVPLIVAGDLHDTKANIRAECVNAMRDTLRLARHEVYDTDGDPLWGNRQAFVLVGNHDKINEKSDANALSFLDEICDVISKPMFTNKVVVKGHSLEFIPYQHDPDAFRAIIKKLGKGSTIICHQGINGSSSGEYIQDKSAINPEDVAGFRVISGHYHTRQTIALPGGGQWDYIGSPYTLNFGEANDPPKGFQILMDDGSLEFVPTNLRAHRVITCGWDDRHGLFWGPILKGQPDDLLWVKVVGTKEQLAVVDKQWLARQSETLATGNFRLDLIPIDTTAQIEAPQDLPQDALLDGLIDSLTNTSNERKLRLKDLWKTLVAK